MTHLCFEAKMSLRWTGWRRRLLLGCHNVKYVLIVSERNTGIHLNPEAVVTCEGGRCTAVQRNDQFCSTRGSQSQKFYFCIQAVLIIAYFLLGFSLVTNKAILLNTTNSVENCSSHVIPSGLERNYLSIKWKKEKTTPKAFLYLYQKLGIICASSSSPAEHWNSPLTWIITSFGKKESCFCVIINTFYNSFKIKTPYPPSLLHATAQIPWAQVFRSCHQVLPRDVF